MITARPAAVSVQQSPHAKAELILGDLLHDLSELGELLGVELQRENWLDAFLLAAGMNQVVEDYLHRDVGSLAKVVTNLRNAPVVGTAVVKSINSARKFALATRASLGTERSVGTWQLQLSELALELSSHVASRGHSAWARRGSLDWRQILTRTSSVPIALQREVVRLPTCFRSLDLEPADVERLVDSFAARWPDRRRRLLVLGIRTSGSYLGPLHVAFLRQCGFESVSLITIRPGHDLLTREINQLSQAAQQDSLAIIADDPPSTGAAVAATASLLEEIGFPTSQIVLSLPLLGSADGLPGRLRRYPAVLLDRRDWAVEERLEPDSVRSALEMMLEGKASVESVSRQPLPVVKDPREDGTRRRHLRALFDVRLRDGAGQAQSHLVYVKGTGLGYFGGPSIAVAESLRAHLPNIYGACGGLLFREWQPEAQRLGATQTSVESVAESIASYTLNRSHALAVSRDLSLRMVGRQAVWQRIADVLAEPFGRLRLPLRPGLHLLAKRLLMVPGASVVDGSMSLRQWFTEGPRGGTVKVDYDELAFSNEDIYSYDHVHDLASAASSLRTEIGPHAAFALREAYERAAGARVDEERWFLYQLQSARQLRRTLRSNVAGTLLAARPSVLDLLDAVESTLEGVQRDYMRTRFLSDVATAQSGPLCAIDIDGTLETAPLGFTSINVAGALALRALSLHGFRAVLASGRSLDEIRTRCEAYSLPAGVAEYGAVVYISASGEVVEVLDKAERARMDRLRSVVAKADGVWLDKRYRCAIRAYTLDRDGRRRGLPREAVSSVLSAAGAEREVIAIPGWSQTDFVAASINKADGLRVAAGRLAGSGRSLFQLAVGDAPTDMSMLRLARLACVPADGSRELHVPGVGVMSKCGQAGLAQAVGRLIGHEPGSCSRCKPLEAGPQARLLLSLMAAYDERSWRRLSQIAFAMWRLRQT